MLAFPTPPDALRGRISAPCGSVVIVFGFLLHGAEFVNFVVEFIGGKFVGDRFVADDAEDFVHALILLPSGGGVKANPLLDFAPSRG
jgi:hypothetical protein